MSLFPEIKSNDYNGFIEKFYVQYKYFVNELDQWWYCYDDIIKFIRMNENYADKLYDKDIDDNNKIMVEDWNNYREDGSCYSFPRRFITSIEVRRLIKRNNDRNNVLIKSMNILEFREDAHDKYHDDEELYDIMHKTQNAIEDKDYEEWAIQIHRSYHSESFRDIADKLGIIDKEFEEAVDRLRDLIENSDEEKTITIKKCNNIWDSWINE